MKQATTLQFRNAVRQAMKSVGVTPYTSWTNRTVNTKERTVGFSVYRGDNVQIAIKTERLLNDQGLTASTYSTDAMGSYRGGSYVRGRCKAVK